MIRSLRASSQSPAPPCVGREHDFALVLSALTTARQHSLGALVAVTGPPGIGKSTFLRAIERRARDEATILSAHCRGGLPSHRPLVELLEALLPQLAPRRDGLPDRAIELRDTLYGAASADHPHRAETYDRLAALLVTVASERPLVVVLHDLDAADIVTRQAIEYLAATLASAPEVGIRHFRGLIVASGNELPGLGSAADWSAGLNLHHLALAPLDREGTRAYLGSERLVSRALELTGGSPHRLEGLFAKAPPENVLALEATSAEREVLEVLAVSARPLSVEALGRLCEQTAPRLKTSINRWLERGILEKAVIDGELRLTFRRTGDEHASYAALEGPRRRALHARMGRYLISHLPHETEAAARHLLAAEVTEGISLALEAARRLEIAHCPERAAELYGAALPLASGEERLQLRRSLCRCFERAGDLDRAIELAGQIRDEAPGPEATLQLAELRLARGDAAGAEELLLSLDRAEEPVAFRLRVLAAQAEARHLAGHAAASNEAAEAGLALWRGVAPAESATAIRLRATLGRLRWDTGESATAAALFAENLSAARASGLELEEARALAQLGSLQGAEGDYERAERSYREAKDLAAHVGDQRVLGACLQHLGVLADRRGRHTDAVNYYQRAVTSWKRIGHRTFLAWVSQDLGKLYLALNDVERAQAMASLARRLAGKQPAAALDENILLLLGELAAVQHRHGEAEARFNEALSLAKLSHHRERARRAQLALASLHLRRDDPAQARAMLDGLETPSPSAALVLRDKELRAQLAEKEGQGEETMARWGEALEMAERHDDLRLAWRCRAKLSLLARAAGKLRQAQRWARQARRSDAQLHQLTPAEFHPHLAEEALRQQVREIEPGPDTAELVPAVGATVEERSGGIIGQHPRISQVMRQIAKVGPTDTTVLIRGESGTGKELVADALHAASPRADKSLVKVNCGALVESLLLSELFGHERGAFTGALQRRQGRFELADGGTIFLDEIGDISPKTQVALLRVLQERSFERVGGTSALKVDVRVIFATHRDLEQMVARGEFREDLYYRLRGVEIELPPLRARRSDIPRLATHLLQRVAEERESRPMRLSESALALLGRHRWPGNVRELDNVLRSVTLFAEGDELRAEHFTDFPELQRDLPTRAEDEARHGNAAAYQELREAGISLRDYKKRVEGLCIASALSDAEGNITHAAQLLGMKRPRLSQLIKEHGLTTKGATVGKGEHDAS